MEEEKTNQQAEAAEEDFAKLFEEQEDQQRLTKESGPVFFGRVICRQEDYYLLDIGQKLEGRVPVDSLPGGLELAPGARLPVLRAGSGGEGYGPKLSLRGAVRKLQWQKLQELQKTDAILDAQIFRPKVEGFFVGLQIEFEPNEAMAGVPQQLWRAFPYPAEMPIGEVDLGDPRPLRRWAGRKVQVKMMEIKPNGDVLVSRRKLAQERRQAQRDVYWDRIKAGDVVAARVKVVEPLGALVDIEGLEGVLSQTEVSWFPKPDPQRHLRQGETIDVKIIKKDEAKRRLLVSRRALLPHPADEMQKEFKKGTKVEGVVSKVLGSGGCFVKLPNSKREAFIPPGELAKDTPLKEGSSVKAVMLRVDRDNIRLVLSPRKLEEMEMPEIMARYTQEARAFSLGELLSTDDEPGESEES